MEPDEEEYLKYIHDSSGFIQAATCFYVERSFIFSHQFSSFRSSNDIIGIFIAIVIVTVVVIVIIIGIIRFFGVVWIKIFELLDYILALF